MIGAGRWYALMEFLKGFPLSEFFNWWAIIYSLHIECSNDLVNVMYDGESSTITCTFYDPQNITGKSCIIEYRICNSQLMGQSLEASSTLDSPNTVILTLQSIEPNQMYCYNVTASGVSYTVIVMGMIGAYRCCLISICMDLLWHSFRHGSWQHCQYRSDRCCSSCSSYRYHCGFFDNNFCGNNLYQIQKQETNW